MYSSVARLNKMSFDSACKMSTWVPGVVDRKEGKSVAAVEKERSETELRRGFKRFSIIIINYNSDKNESSFFLKLSYTLKHFHQSIKEPASSNEK